MPHACVSPHPVADSFVGASGGPPRHDPPFPPLPPPRCRVAHSPADIAVIKARFRNRKFLLPLLDQGPNNQYLQMRVALAKVHWKYLARRLAWYTVWCLAWCMVWHIAWYIAWLMTRRVVHCIALPPSLTQAHSMNRTLVLPVWLPHGGKVIRPPLIAPKLGACASSAALGDSRPPGALAAQPFLGVRVSRLQSRRCHCV